MTTFEFRLPDPGEGLTEAEIVEWHVEEGDDIEEDDTLCEVETDKAVSDVPSPCPGTIEERTASEGDTVDVGTVIVVIETENPPEQQVGGRTETEAEAEGTEKEADETEEPEEETEETAEEPTEETEEVIEEPTEKEAEETTEKPADEDEPEEKEEKEKEETAVESDRVFAAPHTRRYARKEGVELSEIDGSGPEGRVLQADIDAQLQEPAAESATFEIEHPTVGIEPTSIDEDESRSRRRELSGLRKRIAENMTESKTIVPHLTSGFECDATEFVALKERLDEKNDVHITYTPLFVKAVVPALKEFPIVNASIDDTTDEIVEKRYYNIGVATHTEDGLIVPVIKDVDTKSIVEISEELESLVEQARDRSISPSDLQNGTFTVTNLATYGEHRTFGTPVINYPEAAILGIGRIRNRPVAVDDETVAVRSRIGLNLSYDHRLIDGAVANQFMEYVIDGIEDTDVLLSRL